MLLMRYLTLLLYDFKFMLWVVHIYDYFGVSLFIFVLHDQNVIFKLCLCVLELRHNVKFMDGQKGENGRERGMKQPQTQGDD